MTRRDQVRQSVKKLEVQRTRAGATGDMKLVHVQLSEGYSGDGTYGQGCDA